MKMDRKVKTESNAIKLNTEKKGRGSATKPASKTNGKHSPMPYEHAPIGIVESSLDGKYLNVNKEFCRMLGYKKQELLKGGIKVFTHEEDYPTDIELYEQLVAGEIPFYKLEKRFIHKNGGIVWAELTRSTVRNARGKILYIVSAVLDINERKKSEAQVKWQAHLLAELADAVVSTDENFVLTGWNKAAEEIYGWKAEEVLGKNAQDVLQTEFITGTREVAREEARSLGSFSGEVWQKRKDGTRIIVEGKIIAIRNEEEEIQGYVGVNRDVTERKRADDALRESQHRFAATYQYAPIGIAECSREGKYLNVNEEFCNLLGYEKEELIGRGFKGITHEEDYAIDIRLHQKLVAGEIPFYKFEKRYVRKDGKIIWAEITRSPVRDASGKILYTIGTVLDISERKQVESVLHESVERLRLATEAARMFTWEWNFEKEIFALSDSFAQVLGFPTELLPKNSLDTLQNLVPPEDLQSIAYAYQKIIEQRGDLYALPCRVINPANRQVSWLEISAKIVYDPNGAPERMFGVAQNITENKNAQDEMAIISRMPEENPNPVMRLRPDGTVIYANGPSKLMLETWRLAGDQTVPDELQKHIAEAFASGSRKEIEISQNGKTFSCTVAPIVEAGYVNFYGNEITKRKQAEQALRESARQKEALYQLSDRLHRTTSLEDVFNAALDAIINALQCDRASILLYDNTNIMRFAAWRDLSDEYRHATDGHSPWTPDEQNPEPILISDVRTAELSASLKEVIVKEGIGSLAFIPLVSNGKLIGKFMVYFNAPHVFNEGELDLSLTIAHQLAFGVDRQRAEEALAREQELLERLIETMPVMVSMYDPETSLLRFNAEFERRTGWKTDEVSVVSLLESLYPNPDYRQQVLQRMAAAAGTNEWVEVQIQTRDGRQIDSLWSNISIMNDQKLVRGIALGIDITERKRIEQDLTRERELLNRIFESIPVMLTVYEPSTQLLRVNSKFEQLIGWNNEDISGISLMEAVYPEPSYREAVSQFMDRAAENEWMDIQMRTRDGRTLETSWSNRRLSNDMQVGIGIDITERKQAEEVLRRNEKMFSTLINAAPFGVYLIDSEFRLRAINKGSEAVFSGIQPLIGRDFAEILRILWQEPFATEAIERFRHTLRTGESFISPPIIEERANIGEIQSYDWQIHRIPLADGKYGVVCYFYDLSEQKRMEAAVRASESLYRTIARNIPGGGIYVVDKDFRYLVAEGPVTEAFGLSRQMLEGRTVSEVFPDERGKRVEERLRQNFAGETVSFETEHEGRFYWTQQAPLLDSIGQAIILTLDITERKQAEEALRQSEERFARFMQHLPGLAWIKDLQGRYVYANAAAEKAFNTPRRELYGKTDQDIFAPEVAVQYRNNDEQALMDEKGIQVVEALRHMDGVLHYSLVNKFPIPGPAGTPTLIGGTAFDITERLQAEEALRQSEERFRAILRQATAGIVRKDEEGKLIFVNQAFCNMLGYTEADLLGKTVWDFMHEEDIAENKRSYERLMIEGVPFKQERRFIREDGSVIWVDASVSPIMDAEGKPQSAVAVEVDITGRKQAEDALQQLNLQLEERVLNRTAKLRAVNQTLRDEIAERKRVEEALRQSEATARSNEEKLSTLFDLLPVGISFLDPEGQIIQMNSALANILKLSKEQLLNRVYQDRKYIRADGTPMAPSEFASMRALTENKTVHNVETGIILENGQVSWTNVSAAPVDVADVSAVVVTVDITDSKRAEQALQESHARLRILSQRLVEVQEEERRALARELHDRVGQTLAALNINLIIINSQLTPEVTQQIGTRLNDSMKLVAETIALVRDVMTDLRPSVLDDYGLEAALDSHLAQYISRYEIDAKFERPEHALPRLGPSIEMTFLRIAQEALMNIAKHAQATQVRLSLRQEGDSICLTIRDNGIGIESWQEANRPGSHGLTIMRERAEAFSGTLHVNSVPGTGTRVEVSIPIRMNAQKETGEEEKKW